MDAPLRAPIFLSNFPVYTHINAAHVTSPVLDALAIAIRVGRICQSAVHPLFEQTKRSRGLRFAFYFAQALAMIAMGGFIAIRAQG